MTDSVPGSSGPEPTTPAPTSTPTAPPTPTTPPTPPPPVPAPELRCLNCGYTLRGLTEHRCPECGERFDPESLLRLYEGQATTILRWPSGRRRTIFGVFFEVLLRPRRFAREFPARHDAGEAFAYSACCYGLACGLVVLLFGLMDTESLMDVPAICAGGVGAGCLCEIVCAALLAALVKPTRALAGYHFWRGFTHFTSGFIVLTGAWFGTMPWISYGTLEIVGAMAAGMMVFAWWWSNLCAMVAERAAPGSGMIVARVALLFVGLLSVPLAGVLIALLANCCMFLRY